MYPIIRIISKSVVYIVLYTTYTDNSQPGGEIIEYNQFIHVIFQ